MALENPRNATSRQRDKDPDSRLGLTFPLSMGSKGYFKTSSTLLEQTKSNLKNLLLTVKGERIAQPEFGSGIYNVLFENFDSDFTERMRSEINDSIQQWLPHVIVKGLVIDAQPDNNLVSIELSFGLVQDANATESITLNLQRDI